MVNITAEVRDLKSLICCDGEENMGICPLCGIGLPVGDDPAWHIGDELRWHLEGVHGANREVVCKFVDALCNVAFSEE